MDMSGKHCPKAPAHDPLASSVPLFDPAQLPLRQWCAGSREDAVTGLIAFPDFHSHIPRALAAVLADGGLVGLAIGDVDGLKAHVEKANATEPDCYGHLAGNKVMARLGAVTCSWFHTQPWDAGCAATFAGDEVIIAAALDDAPAFHRAVAELRDRLADELPVPVSFALAFAAAEHLPAERGPGGWKHAFTDRLLAAVDRCLFTHKAARRAAGGDGGIIALTQPPPPPTTPATAPATIRPSTTCWPPASPWTARSASWTWAPAPAYSPSPSPSTSPRSSPSIRSRACSRPGRNSRRTARSPTFTGCRATPPPS